MDAKAHWDKIHTEKARDGVSWYTPHLDWSLKLIDQLAGNRASSILDVGGGQSTLVDDLLGRGYLNITVLDIAQAAIAAGKARLGKASKGVKWIAGDITRCILEPAAFDLWHDRAVFHFLTEANDRRAYVGQVLHALKPGGHLIISTFEMEGPERCSGLDVVRYDRATLLAAFGARFRMLGDATEEHRTPFGTRQPFLYGWFVLEESGGS
jgi:SAM-dependent methyltransferase